MIRPSRVRSWWPIVVWLTVTSAVSAQSRAELIRDGIAASELGFSEQEALRLLTAGVDPALGPPDVFWRDGVRAIARIHLQNRRDGLAGTWLRWAARLDPDLSAPANSMVAGPLRAARDSVARVAGDSLAPTRWIWSAQAGATDGTGGLRVNAPVLSVPVRVLVIGVGVLGATEETLEAGTYAIEASADGYATTRITREILPGVTTVVDLNLARPRAAAAPPPARAQPAGTPAVRSRPRRPYPMHNIYVHVGGGVAFAGASSEAAQVLNNEFEVANSAQAWVLARAGIRNVFQFDVRITDAAHSFQQVQVVGGQYQFTPEILMDFNTTEWMAKVNPLFFVSPTKALFVVLGKGDVDWKTDGEDVSGLNLLFSGTTELQGVEYALLARGASLNVALTRYAITYDLATVAGVTQAVNIEATHWSLGVSMAIGIGW